MNCIKKAIHSTPLLIREGLGVGLLLLLFASCTSEDTKPSYADTDRLESLVDRSIPSVADFCDKYGTYLLYNFDQQLDFAYQFQEASNWNKATIEKMNRNEAIEADKFLMDEFFSKYNDDFKKKYLPRKMITVKQIKAQALGIAEPDEQGLITAAANINSMTIAYDKARYEALSTSQQTEYQQQLHYILLASYLINVRAEYPVDDAYIAYSQAYYASLMDPNRTQARRLPDEFFLNRGFFRPDDDESTYFVSAEEDMIAFTKQLILMDEEMRDSLMEYPVMAEKMHYLAQGLSDMGVDVQQINPWTEDFLKIENASIKPTVSIAPIVTTTGEATMQVTIGRGAHDFSHAEVWVNNTLYTTIDLSDKATAAKFVKNVELQGLIEGPNAIEVRVFEVGRTRPSQTASIIASYVSMKNIEGFRIMKSTGENYRFFEYADHDYIEGKDVKGLTTVRFIKVPTFNEKTFEEEGGITRFWKIYKNDGLVSRIVTYDQQIDEDYQPYYNVLCTYEFTYNEYGELTEAKRNGETFVSDVTYQNGNIIRYKYEGAPTPYAPAYATANGITVRVDCLDEQMSGHRFGFTGEENPNPFFITGLPAIIPGNEAEIPLQLLYSQYLFNSIEGIWNSGWKLSGRTNDAVVTLDGVTYTYRFVLK